MIEPSTSFIAVDWGTSSFRAYLVDGCGVVVDRVASADGILKFERAQFPDVLKRNLQGWSDRYGPLPVVMSGMIGSRQGWVEAAYVPTPATLRDLLGAVQMLAVGGLGPIMIVPGVATRDTAGLPDVMRGEETQVFGAMTILDRADGLFVLPGTHSKWVGVDNGAISSLQTFMTGEVYAVLKEHSILGRLMGDGLRGQGGIGDGFRRGLDVIARYGGGPGGLLNRIFTTRTLGLFGEIKSEDMADYLSGLLIGAEVVEAGVSDAAVWIIADDALAQRYVQGCHAFGLACRTVAQDCVVAGQRAIALAKNVVVEGE